MLVGAVLGLLRADGFRNLARLCLVVGAPGQSTRVNRAVPTEAVLGADIKHSRTAARRRGGAVSGRRSGRRTLDLLAGPGHVVRAPFHGTWIDGAVATEAVVGADIVRQCPVAMDHRFEAVALRRFRLDLLASLGLVVRTPAESTGIDRA